MKLTDTIKTKNGRFVVVDTCYTLDHGLETMVFTSDEQGNVTSWTDLDAETYSTPEEAEEGHRQMIEKWKESKRPLRLWKKVE